MKIRLMLFAGFIAIAACSSDSTSGPDDDDDDDLPAMSAKVDGATWTPSIAITAVNPTAGLYSITATRTSGANNYTMVFSLYNIKGPGTYPLGVTPSVFGGTANLSRPPAEGWTTPLNGVAGEFKITTLTANRMVATFNFETTPVVPGTTGSPKVTDGTLDIPVSGTGGLALENQGGTFTGNVGGPFAASATSLIMSNPTGSNNTLSITGSNGTRSVTIVLSNMTGAGAYTLSAALPIRSITVSGMPGNATATWASQASGGSGTVNIATVTTTRITGSFTATLVPLAGGASGNLAISGTFDIGRLIN